ncbi:IMPACT family protein [Brachybacterium huguangmaarense]|uniref:IMPACT family protein n=1 Tax=Brachybacterium huguangmaarense TaxID=1652028 RepID=A0ABY6G641_9MICO|nr:YigZ family protein [Brachybacterium huguangmaarense]UYG18094.1 IMPACT family protein [Brachybacterium huguangmaarense]
MPDVLTLAAPAEAELVEKKSRFLARLAPAATVEDADAVIHAARIASPGARHHCSAMIIDAEPSPVTRSNDDGEPSGTAGMPILQVLQGAHVTNVIAVVTRHFGGIKLGTGGLARAYGGAVSTALASATLLRRTAVAVVTLEVPHAQAGAAENAVRLFVAAHGGQVEPAEYGSTGVRLTVLVGPDLVDALRADVAAWSGGRLSPALRGERVLDLPL